MKLWVPRQIGDGETRVPLVPAVVKRLVSEQVQVCAEAGLGMLAGFDDAAYEQAGAMLVHDDAAWADADLVVTLEPPSPQQAQRMKAEAVLVGMLAPLAHAELIQVLAQRKVTSFSMEFLPRISRAQSMDVLSSQANIGGYKAVVMAADHCPKMFPMMITAAGTLAPAKVFILGAGVAGLQAIATAKRLGAIVEAFDVRAATKEQIQSLGARFVELPTAAQDDKATGGYAREQTEEERRQQTELMAKHIIGADVVIATAAVFGKAPPMLIPADVVAKMNPGSVIVDLAAAREHGRGNCEATKPGEIHRTDRGVTIIGTLNLPAHLPVHASQAYANNMHAFLKEIISKEGQVQLNLEDEIQHNAVITHDGEVVNKKVMSGE